MLPINIHIKFVFTFRHSDQTKYIKQYKQNVFDEYTDIHIHMVSHITMKFG